ncbi:glycosyltransferase [Micromonospora sp. NPDC005305]|uniref:glycosyltransferase family 4 protein n=1 Tax=Micromonospora sp. NPDC005305 TaxID=3156875 RepID=UPI0033A5DA2C
MTGRPDVVLVQTAIGDYRQSFLDQVCAALGDRLLVLTGPIYFEPSLVTAVVVRRRHNLRNRFLAGRRLLIQTGGLFRNALPARIVVLELNPRVLSSWALILARRALGRRTVGWGHAFPRSGPQSRTDAIRSIMRRLCGEMMVYTYRQETELAAREPGLTIHVVPNSTQPTVAPVTGSRTGVIYCGRLSPDKRPELLVDAFAKAAGTGLPPDCVLTMVGDGPQRGELEALAQRLGLAGRIRFTGRISDVSALKELYGDALISTSPGYAGLALTQSLAFGVPMIIADDEPHAPEIELAGENNSVYFRARDVNALAAALVTQFARRQEWIEATADISHEAQALYSSEAMAEAFVAVVG